ncbi:hypothetical protein ABNQ39_20595 [Azospirillum sp. A26]|uniref:hypothetical protein n=1 Tax=Azospirillum sp. A26 TaxID=3160607 RepID=UPI00366D14C0
MALTDAQLADVRRYAGYWVAGTSQPVNDDQDTVYMRFGMVIMSLHKRLTTLSVSEEAVLVNTYLTNLATLETGILGAADNLDTASAAVWVRNANEVGDRTSLFRQWRCAMCDFLGLPYGPGLQQQSRLVRC